jgi:NAD(P)-dependent dehydrogenase (short-subunit alcohol dehydrogenase family)
MNLELEGKRGLVSGSSAGIGWAIAATTRGTRVTVNSILTGPTRIEGVGTFVEGLAAQRGVPAAQVERDFFFTSRPSSLLQRFATPEEIAVFTVFVASGPASAVNGAALKVDGGVVRAIV